MKKSPLAAPSSVIPTVGRKADVEPPREPVPAKKGSAKVTVLADPVVAHWLAIAVLTVSVLRFKLASYPSSVTFIFCAGSFDVNSTLNLKPLAVYSPFAKVLN